MMELLKKQWTDLCSLYTSNFELVEKNYSQIHCSYTEKHRHYHNLEHIHTMLNEINNCNDNSLDKNTLLFAAWFHDIIYNPKKHNNEQLSAEIAEESLQQLTIPLEKINKTKQLIIATANHMNNPSNIDLDFFLDCDLKILGATREEYLQYANNIRNEYSHVISFIYKMERKKILKRFIQSDSIYKTSFFKTKYETQARANILYEIETL